MATTRIMDNIKRLDMGEDYTRSLYGKSHLPAHFDAPEVGEITQAKQGRQVWVFHMDILGIRVVTWIAAVQVH